MSYTLEQLSERFDDGISALENIAQELSRLNDFLEKVGSGNVVLCVDTGLDKGEPLQVEIVKGMPR